MARDISSTRGFTRGGQVFKNNIMMFAQSANNILLLGLIVFGVSFVLGTFMFVQKWRLEILFGVLKASFMGWFNASSAMTFKVASHTFHATAHEWLANTDIQGYMADLKVMLFHIGLIAFVIGVLSAGLTALYFRKTGISAIEEQYVRGPLLEDAKKVKNHIKKLKVNGKKVGLSHIRTGPLNYPEHFERQHMMIHGTSGSGKSVLFTTISNQIHRGKGTKVAQFDLNGEALSRQYNNGDVILNPFDERSMRYSIWTDCKDPEDFDNLAEILIPDNPRVDPIWINAPRQIFVESAKKMASDPDRSHTKLLKLMLNTPIKEYTQYFAGTSAASFADDRIEKTTLSVRAVLASYLKSLQYLDLPQGDAFSIRDWVANDDDNRWLFMSVMDDRLAVMRPLLSSWIGMISKSCLSLPRDDGNKRNIWLMADEVGSLNQIPTLPDFLAKARKFGGHAIIGLQAIAQLVRRYGEHTTIEMVDNMNTHGYFRSRHTQTCEFVSSIIGNQEIEEVRENFSIGANSIRDGVSFGKTRVSRRLVSPEEIRMLNDLECYIVQKGAIPVAKITLDIPKSKHVASHFVPRDITVDEELKHMIAAARWNGDVITDENLAYIIKSTSDDIKTEAKNVVASGVATEPKAHKSKDFSNQAKVAQEKIEQSNRNAQQLVDQITETTRNDDDKEFDV
jgi:type IV conjugative transfer system coupling protein TraD